MTIKELRIMLQELESRNECWDEFDVLTSDSDGVARKVVGLVEEGGGNMIILTLSKNLAE